MVFFEKKGIFQRRFFEKDKPGKENSGGICPV
jgi:hypothetical protein